MVSANSWIDVSAKGYLPGFTSGNTTVGASQGGAAGSYGGLADISPLAYQVNATYGDYADPNDWGSGSGLVRGGSAGGGLVRLMARSLQLDGEILANGGRTLLHPWIGRWGAGRGDESGAREHPLLRVDAAIVAAAGAGIAVYA